MPRRTFRRIVITARGGAALMFAAKLTKNFKKNFFQKIFFSPSKTLSRRLSIKKSKNFFSGQISLEFFCASQISLFSIILKLAQIDRKMLSGDLDGFIKKIR